MKKYYPGDRTGDTKIIGIKNGMSQVELIEEIIEKNNEYSDFENFFSGYNQEFWHKQDIALNLNPPLLKGKLKKGGKSYRHYEIWAGISFFVQTI